MGRFPQYPGGDFPGMPVTVVPRQLCSGASQARQIGFEVEEHNWLLP